MKQTLLFTLLALLGMSQAAAQEYEYVPFVREGVKWVYICDDPFYGGYCDGMVEGRQYYSFEMKNDVVIGDKQYKEVYVTHYLDDGCKQVENFIPVYLREENKSVYAIILDSIFHPQCPVGYFDFVGASHNGCVSIGQEFLLYDFNSPTAIYDRVFDSDDSGLELQYLYTDTLDLGSHLGKCHHYDWIYTDENKIIESIGYDGSAGMPLFYFEYFISGLQITYYLSHVIEDGEIIYKGVGYRSDIHVGIDEVVADQSRRPQDDNYYNLMGRPVGKDIPTTPGIYIHQGKKVCVSRTR